MLGISAGRPRTALKAELSHAISSKIPLSTKELHEQQGRILCYFLTFVPFEIQSFIRIKIKGKKKKKDKGWQATVSIQTELLKWLQTGAGIPDLSTQSGRESFHLWQPLPVGFSTFLCLSPKSGSAVCAGIHWEPRPGYLGLEGTHHWHLDLSSAFK